jgi:two-component system OmpR family response regulator
MDKKAPLHGVGHDGGGPTILLVEDRLSVVRLLAVGFEYLGLTLNPVFNSAASLLEALQRDSFPDVDLFLIDIKLPDGDGVELAQKLRAAGEKRPIALTSAWAPPQRGVLTQLDAVYVSKPFHLPRLARELQYLAAAGRSRRKIQPAMSA